MSERAPIDLPINFAVDPNSYRHWRLAFDGPVATVTMAVTPDAGLRDDYELKLNSYDLSVDIELYDIAQRLRFGHPEVKCVVVTGGVDKVFCAGANIQMLATSSHGHKVNFCKFTNETRNGIEDATANSQQVWIAAVNGTAAGGGYELALACDEILLIDDRASAVSLPEVPLLAVLPGTGGLTRVVDKRFVRRDLADVFATRTEGIKGQQAVDWGLVDAIAPKSSFDELVATHARGAGGGFRPAVRWGRDRAAATRVVDGDRRRHAAVDVRRRRHRPRARVRPTHRSRARNFPARHRRRTRVRRQRRMDRSGGARTRPRHPPSAVRRTTDRHVGPDDERQHRSGLPGRGPVRQRQRPLARPRGPAVLDAHAEATRCVRAHPRHADRTGELLRRRPRRAGAGRGPVADVRRHTRRAGRPGRSRPDHPSHRRERRRAPHVERVESPRVAVLGPRGRAGRRPGRRSARTSSRRTR